MNHHNMIVKSISGLLALGFLSACVAPQTVNLRDSLPCEDVLQMQTAESNRDIKWVFGNNISPKKYAGCLITLGSKLNTATIETEAYLTSDLYIFSHECRDSAQIIYRIFEYKNKGRPYLLRLHTNQFVDPYTYVVVGSYPKGNSDYYHHSIIQKTNDFDKIDPCHAEKNN